MLILSRRIGEAVMIEDDVRVVVLSVSSGGVRLGIDAPRSVEVHREEVYKRLHTDDGDTTRPALRIAEPPVRDTETDCTATEVADTNEL